MENGGGSDRSVMLVVEATDNNDFYFKADLQTSAGFFRRVIDNKDFSHGSCTHHK